jgi:hypothetical protein
MNTKLKRNLRRGLAAATVVVATAGAFSAPAMAAPSNGYGPRLGSLFLTIPSGTATSLFLMNTDAPCPLPSTHVIAYISHVDTLPAPQDPANTWDGIILRSPDANNTTNDVPMAIPINNTITATATTVGKNLPSGDYNIKIRCQNSLSTVITGHFEGNFTLTNPNSPVNNQISTYTSVAQPAVVAPTVLVASSLPTFIQGATTTLSATVAQPAAALGGMPKGKVEFFDGATSLGGATSLNATGVASLTNSTLAVGTHSITAAYSGDAFYYTPVTSAPVSVVVTAAPAVTTTTTIAATINGAVATSPANGSTTDNVSLTGTVAPASSVGTCQYFDGASPLGLPAPVVNGVCPVKDLGQSPEKLYSYTVKFVPTNPAVFLASESGVFAVNLVASSIAPAVETVNVTVEAGALTISLADATKSQVTMSVPVLTTDARMLTSTGTMQTVRVADLRAGNPGWTAKGQVSNFLGQVPANSGKIIRGNNLGWTPKLISKNTNQTIVMGTAVLSPDLPIDAAAAVSGTGIFAPVVLATAAANAGTGTADLGADLTLNVPTNTVAGLYSATLTLTVA